MARHHALRDAAPQYRTNLSVSGGNARARYYFSFSYLRQEGLFDTKWTEWNEGYSTQEVLNRYNLRSNIDIDVNKFLNVSMDLGGRIDNISQPGIDVWNLFTWGEPAKTFRCIPYSARTVNSLCRPAATVKTVPHKSPDVVWNRTAAVTSIQPVTATGNLDALVPGLKAKMTFSFDSYETFQKVQQADINVYYYNYMADVNDPSEYTYQRMRTYKALPNATTSPRDYYYNLNMNGGLAYEHTFGKHAVNAQAFIRTYQNVVRGQESSNRYSLIMHRLPMYITTGISFPVISPAWAVIIMPTARFRNIPRRFRGMGTFRRIMAEELVRESPETPCFLRTGGTSCDRRQPLPVPRYIHRRRRI